MSIQDPALNYRYVDYYYFSFMSDMGSEGATVWRWVMVYGRGPKKDRLSSMITVAGTIDANIALEMEQGYQDIWNGLTNDEKKFVKAHPALAASFLSARNNAIEDTQSRFSPQDMDDGTRGNAFQHAMWNALMTQLGTENYAAEYANAHENYPRNVNDTTENTFRNMDLHNNNIGRQIATCNFTATRIEMANLIIQALNSGQLQVVCPPTCRQH